jgi:hypothetical protein
MGTYNVKNVYLEKKEEFSSLQKQICVISRENLREFSLGPNVVIYVGKI